MKTRVQESRRLLHVGESFGYQIKGTDAYIKSRWPTVTSVGITDKKNCMVFNFVDGSFYNSKMER